MSAVAALQEAVAEAPALRILALEEVKPLPFPIKPVYAKDWTPENAENLWNLLSQQPFVFDDETRALGLQGLMAAIECGDVKTFEIGDSDGLIWVQNIRPDNTAAVNIVFWGNRKAFVAAFGSGKETKPLALSYIMDALKLRKLRAYIEVENKASWRMAERAGFKREAHFRKEKARAGAYRDVYVYGLLREEVNVESY